MASPFWKYFHEKLGWSLIHSPGPIAAIIKGLAHRLDGVREDAIFTRRQWYPQLCEPEMVPLHGTSRGLTRYYKETPEQFRDRVINAYAWHMLGGKQEGVPQILEFYGFPGVTIENMAHFSLTRWAEFQVSLADAGTMEQYVALVSELDFLVWLLQEYKPARSRLFRIYNNSYDVRPLIFSRGKWSHNWYSFFSGVTVPDIDDDTLISLGWRTAVLMPQPDVDCFFAGDEDCGLVIPWDRLTTDVTLSAEEEYSVHFCEPVWITEQWSGNWDYRPWAVLLDWVRPGAITVWHNPGIDTETAVRFPDDLAPDVFFDIEANLDAEIRAMLDDDIHAAVEAEAGIDIPSLIGNDFFPAIEVDLAAQLPQTPEPEIRDGLEMDLSAQLPGLQATILPGVESTLGAQIPGLGGDDIHVLVELNYDQNIYWSGNWDAQRWSQT